MSQAGSFVLLIAMAWTAVRLGGSIGVSVLMLAATLPRALMLLFGGAVADVLGLRYVLLRTMAARVVVLLSGAFVAFHVERLWPLIVISLLEGTLLGLGGPSSTSVLPQLAKGDALARANSLYSIVLRLAPIVGVPVGAWLIARGQVGHALLVSALACMAGLGSLLYVTRGITPPGREPGESMLRRSADGLRLLVRYPRLRWMFVASFALDLAFSWPTEVALPLLVSERGWNVGVVGYVVAAFGAGAIVSSGLGAVLAHRIPLFARLVVAGAGIAVGIVTMALVPSVAALCTLIFVVGLMFGLTGPAIITVYQESAPPSRMGAAMASFSLSAIGAAPLSIAVFSGLSVLLGVAATSVVCGVVAFGCPVAALLALRHPTRRSITSTT